MECIYINSDNMSEVIEIFKHAGYDDVVEMEREGRYINLKKPNDSKKYFRYDMVKKQFERINFYKTVDDKVTPVSVKNITGWFKSIRLITTDKKFAKLVLFNKYHWDFSNFRNPVRYIEMLGASKSTYLEQWESLGIKFDDVEDWFRKLKSKEYYYLRHSIRIKYPPSKVSKSLLNYIKKLDKIETHQLNDLIENYNNGEYVILNELMDLERTVNFANIFDITNFYGTNLCVLTENDFRCKNIRNNMLRTISEYHLDIESFCEWIKYQKNVEKNDIDYIMDHYSDYLRMELALKKGIRSKITKYPKHFRDIRQRTIVEFKSYQETISEENFKEVVKMHKDLEYKTKKFSIVLPESSEDINHEADELKHCVRSYIRPMSQNQTLICFCRFTNDIETPLVTIEVKKGAITQAYTKNDRKPSEESLRFIEKWAEKKNLGLAWCW